MTVRGGGYAEGDWFGVPLDGGGWAVGLLARSPRGDPGGLGYFFGPRAEELPKLAELERLRPAEAVLIRIFGDIGLLDGTWPVIGRVLGWEREEWPMPVFVYKDPLLEDTWWRRFYDPDDPGGLWVRQERIGPGGPVDGPYDGASGSRALEIRLSRLLPKMEG